VLDGELCATTGMEGILGMFEARKLSQMLLAFRSPALRRVVPSPFMSEAAA
jgi:hypothetical protein